MSDLTSNVALALVALVVFIGLGMQVLTRREQLRDRRLRRELEYQRHLLENPELYDGEVSQSATPAYMTLQRMSSILAEQSRQIAKLASRDINVYVNMSAQEATDNPRQHPGVTVAEDSTSASLIREITHSLGTPLSQIDTALSLLKNSDSLSVENAKSLSRAKASVATCNAYLQVFRRVVLSEEDSGEPMSGSLRRLIVEAGPDTDVPLNVSLPDSIPPYSNEFLLCMLLPLVDNAIEASRNKANAEVEIYSRSTPDRIQIVVTNPLSDELSPHIYEPGFSTKPGHQGVGLVVVLRLLASVRTAALSYSMDDGRVRFQIDLPREV